MGHIAYIGLGGNLGNSVQIITAAMVALGQDPRCRWIAGSSLWRSKPLDDMPQPDYVNAVAVLDTELEPHPLLDVLQAIENSFGRVRGDRWAARTLDLDLLLFGDRIVSSERLIVPHPGLALRDFVLWPLAELDPELVVPAQGHLRDLLHQCESRGLHRIEMHADANQSDAHKESL